MPTYEYECDKCRALIEITHYMDDVGKEQRCPHCDNVLKRIISSSNFTLKGGGWYKDGYDKGGK